MRQIETTIIAIASSLPKEGDSIPYLAVTPLEESDQLRYESGRMMVEVVQPLGQVACHLSGRLEQGMTPYEASLSYEDAVDGTLSSGLMVLSIAD